MSLSATRLPLYLLLLIMPLAVAGQNIGGGLVFALLLAQLFVRRGHLPTAELWPRFKMPIVASLAYLASLAASTLLNPNNPAQYNLSAIGGHLIWALLPPLAFLAQDPLDAQAWRRVGRYTAIASGILGAFALTQAIWGWHLVGSHIEAGPTRAQGLYSHPLSFAYACMLIFPLGCVLVRRAPRDPIGWLVLVSMLIAIAASRSRTVEVVAAVVMLVNLLLVKSRKLRIGLIVAFLLGGTVIMATNNPIGEKFRGMLDRHDVRSDYPVDDRMAFWAVNWSMFMERPLFGHGENLDEKYRAPYYDAKGLVDFERKYPAHNMYLQWAVNGGIVGFGIAMWWLLWHLRAAWRLRKPELLVGGGTPDCGISWQCLVALCAAAVTQNAFQDSVVRYTLALAVTGMWLAMKPAAPASVPS